RGAPAPCRQARAGPGIPSPAGAEWPCVRGRWSHFRFPCRPRAPKVGETFVVELPEKRSPALSTVAAVSGSRLAQSFPVKGMLYGGAVAGILDGLDAVLYFGIASGAKPAGIFRYIAGGLVGLEAARAGGWATALLGVGLHFLIAFGAAATYCLASTFL